MEGLFVGIIAFIVLSFLLGSAWRGPEPQVIYVQVPVEGQRRVPGIGTMLFLVVGFVMVLGALGII